MEMIYKLLGIWTSLKAYSYYPSVKPRSIILLSEIRNIYFYRIFLSKR